MIKFIISLIIIYLWIRLCVFLENNNNKHKKEFKLLNEKICSDLIMKKASLKFNDVSLSHNVTMGDYVVNKDLIMKNKNIYVKTTIQTYGLVNTRSLLTTTTSKIKNGPEYILQDIRDENDLKMDNDTYKYLAQRNLLLTNSMAYGTTTYNYYLYAIDKNADIYKISGLQKYEKEIDVKLYEYENGPENNIKSRLIKRKQADSSVQINAGRVVSFIILFFAIFLLITPANDTTNIILKFPANIISRLDKDYNLWGMLLLTLIITQMMKHLLNKEKKFVIYILILCIFGYIYNFR
jgi:hypothetical protein